MWNKQGYCWQLQNHVWIQNFRRSNWKIYHARKIFVSLHGPTIWKVTPRNVWNDIVSWQTRRLNNYTKYLHHALMTIISKKKNWNPWENCQKYALRLSWNADIWHVLDPIFYGQWTNLHDRSQNGPKLVTNDYLVSSLTFITQVNTNSIAMWVILPNNAGCDCFKTPILREILRIRNLHQVEHCAFLEAIHLFQSVGFERNKLQFRTFQQNQKSFLWMQDWGWMVFRSCFVGSDRCNSWEHESEPYRTGRLVKEQTWSSFGYSHDSQTQAISESDWWFG